MADEKDFPPLDDEQIEYLKMICMGCGQHIDECRCMEHEYEDQTNG